MDDNSLKTGLMAVFAVSGGVAFLAMHAHNRLLSNFIKKMEFEIKQNSTGVVKDEPVKKKVRFANDVAETRPAATSRRKSCHQNLEGMPQNWQVMYKGILKHRNYNMGYI